MTTLRRVRPQFNIVLIVPTVLLVVAAAAAVVWAVSRRPSAGAAEMGIAAPPPSASDWAVTVEPGWTGGEVTAAVASDSRRVDLFDENRHALVASIVTGYAPQVLLRGSYGIVVDTPAPGMGDVSPGSGRLLEFDLSNRLALVRRVELPFRLSSLSYWHSATVSSDLSAVYYATYQQRSSCPSGGSSEQCDQLGIGVANLGSGYLRTFPMPTGCGGLVVAAAGGGNVLAGCSRTGQIFRVSDATIALEADLSEIAGNDPSPVRSHNPLSLDAIVVMPSGSLAGVFDDGTLRWREAATGQTSIVRVTPQGTRIGAPGPQVFKITEHEILVGYRMEYYDQSLSGYTVFDLSSMSGISTASPARSVSPGPAGSVLLLEAGGNIVESRPSSRVLLTEGVSADIDLLIP